MSNFMEIVGSINTALWSMPMIYLCLGTGIIFTIWMAVPQLRHIPDMARLLFNGKSSENGLSSFQAFTLAIAGRVGTGNIAGVATAIAAGGPGALFWMWMIAIVGSATTFVECTLSQLHKKEINGEYRGGYAYYIGDRFGFKVGGVCAVILALTLAFTQTGVHVNAITSGMSNAFGIPKIATALVVAVLLGLIVFGGAKRIGRFAEIVVPIMSAIYIVAALVILAFNWENIPWAFGLIFKGAFGVDSVVGAAMGSAMIWGTKRAIFSSETGMATATSPAASAEVSHPAKQGLVQAFSVYIDTLFVCTATGLMLVVTGCFNTTDADGNMLFMGLGEAIEAGPIWVQNAMSTVLPFGSQFVAIALFFFAFTTIMNQTYSCTCNVSYFFQKSSTNTKKYDNIVYIIFILGCIYGGIVSASAAWNFGDTGLGIVVWINYISLLVLSGVAVKLLKDFEEQKALANGDLSKIVFDPDKFKGVKGFDTYDLSVWTKIRDNFKSGKVKQ